MGFSQRTKVALVAVAVLSAGATLAVAGKWSPNEFKGPAYYKYRLVNHEDGKPTEILQGLDVEATEQKDDAGNALFRVTTSSQTLVKEDDLASAGLFGPSPFLSMVPALMFGNPMFGTLLSQMDLVVGEKMSFFGAGYAKVVKRETVAGVEGFLCELYGKQDEKDVKVAELVVHPDLSLPLRSRTYQDGELRFEMELLEYKKH